MNSPTPPGVSGPARRVWKYALDLVSGRQVVGMPVVGDIIHVHEQESVPTLWVQVNSSSPLTQRAFYVIATGERMPLEARRHIGTVHIGWTVWHIYEDPSYSGENRTAS